MEISDDEGIMLRKYANELTGIVYRYSTFVDLIKTILNFSNPFEKKYNWNLFETHIVNSVKDMTGSHILTGMSAQFYYRYNRPAKIILSHVGIIALVESLNSYDAGSRRPGISHLDKIGLYTETK